MPQVLVSLSCVNRDYFLPCSYTGRRARFGFDLRYRVCGHVKRQAELRETEQVTGHLSSVQRATLFGKGTLFRSI